MVAKATVAIARASRGVALVACLAVLAAGCGRDGGSQAAETFADVPRSPLEDVTLPYDTIPGPPEPSPAAPEPAATAPAPAEPAPAATVDEAPEPVPAQPPAAAQPPATAEPTPGAKVLRTGAMQAGTYTTAAFRERFELDLPDGWSGALPEQPDIVAIARSSQATDSIAFVYPDAVTGVIRPQASAADVDQLDRTDVEQPPPDWIAWLEGHPRLEVGERREIEVAGRRAVAVDVEVSGGYEADGCPGRCVFTFFDSQGAIYATSSGYRERDIALAVDGAQVLILISAPPDRFERFLRQAEAVLATLRFVDTRPPSADGGPSPAEQTESVPAAPESVAGDGAPGPPQTLPAETPGTATSGEPPTTDEPTTTGDGSTDEQLPPYLSPSPPAPPLEA